MKFLIALGLGFVLLASLGCSSTPDDVRGANNSARLGGGDSAPRVNDFGAEYGPITTFDLRSGDCFDSDGQTVGFDEVLRVPCDGYYTQRVLRTVFIDYDGPWPGEEFLASEAYALCDLDTDSFIGPSPDSWFVGDRTILCLADAP